MRETKVNFEMHANSEQVITEYLQINLLHCVEFYLQHC